jgi:hypothetical protein
MNWTALRSARASHLRRSETTMSSIPSVESDVVDRGCRQPLSWPMV